MNKIFIIYNICGLSGKTNNNQYSKSIESILNQNFNEYKLIISSCLNSQNTIDSLINKHRGKISINWIKDKIPINTSFNHTVIEAIKKFGPAESYLYMDSGVDFENQIDAIQKVYNLYNSGPYGLITIRTDTNHGFHIWFPETGAKTDNDTVADLYFRNLPDNFIVPIGKACNMHCQLFSNKIQEFYGQLWPSIFAGESSESVLGAVIAALKLKHIIHKDLQVHHEHSVDGPSSGFPPWKWVQDTGRPPYDHPFIIDNLMDRIMGGAQYGLFYETIRGVLMPDLSKYDGNGYALDPKLKSYIKDNLFLKKEELDFNKINSEWII